jgi:SAM-dependent methyltransferase
MDQLKSALKKSQTINHTWQIYKAHPNFADYIHSFYKNQTIRLKNRLAGGLPLPDPYLIYLVAGTDDVDWFLHAGLLGASCIRDVLTRNNISMDQMDAILDFGCGVGRVLRHFYPSTHAKLHGTDINELLVSWCRSNLKFADISLNSLNGELPFESGKFDLVYALSVFTHLPESLQFHWIDELTRILKPNGYLLFTTHGEYYLKELLPEDLKKYRNGELVVYNTNEAGSNVCAAFHPYDYVQNILVNGLKIVTYIPEGALGNPRQDLYLVQT